MIDVINKMCDVCNIRQASFNFIGESRKYCFSHKLDEMREVMNKKCIEPNCDKRAYYGPLFMRLIHCYEHMKNNEFSAQINNPICEYENCAEKAFYSNKKGLPLRCEKHVLSDDVNLVERKYKNCGLLELIEYDQDTCVTCLQYDIEKRRIKKYEVAIRNVLDANNILI